MVSDAAARGVVIRPARTSDVRAVRDLVEPLARDRVLISKDAVAYYASLQQFVVAETDDGTLAGCGALHVLWDDLAEIRTLAVGTQHRGRGVGSLLLDALVDRADRLGVRRLFCLTFEVAFFRRHGFEAIDGAPVTPEVYAELLRSYDEGVAEFLDLDRVKPNTLGNTRMLRELHPPVGGAGESGR
jgi:amino-acid N-acetyltransferase